MCMCNEDTCSVCISYCIMYWCEKVCGSNALMFGGEAAGLRPKIKERRADENCTLERIVSIDKTSIWVKLLVSI